MIAKLMIAALVGGLAVGVVLLGGPGSSGDGGVLPIALGDDDEARRDEDVLSESRPSDEDDKGDGDGDNTRGNDGTNGGNNTWKGDGDNTRGNDGTGGGAWSAAWRGDGDNTRGNDGTGGGAYVAPVVSSGGGGGGGGDDTDDGGGGDT